jgi:two-component system NtrC family sensor kinase
MTVQQNRRVLLVDDMPAIHEDYRKSLSGGTASGLDEDEALLFGASRRANSICFETDSAFQGAEAIDKARAAAQAGRPYALAFIDMRMPPGMDGVETIERLWQEDPALQVVLCTAYSDHSWTDVLNRLNVRDRLLILKKPFDAIEVYQLASALTAKWEMTKQALFRTSVLEEVVEERTNELKQANEQLRLKLVEVDSLCAKIGLTR